MTEAIKKIVVEVCMREFPKAENEIVAVELAARAIINKAIKQNITEGELNEIAPFISFLNALKRELIADFVNLHLQNLRRN